MPPRLAAPAIVALTCALAVVPAAADSCNLVTDPRNDTTYAGRTETSGYLVQRALDIVSADVATHRGTLLGSIRVQSLAPDAAPPRDVVYRIEFASGDRRLFVEALRGTRNGFVAGRAGVTASRIDGTVQEAANAVLFRAPIGVFGRGAIGPGSVLGGITVTAVGTYADLGQPGPGVNGAVQVSDSATSGLTYTVGTPSCIVPGQHREPAKPRPKPEPTARPKPEPTTRPTTEPTARPKPEPTARPTPEPSPSPSEPAPTATPLAP